MRKRLLTPALVGLLLFQMGCANGWKLGANRQRPAPETVGTTFIAPPALDNAPPPPPAPARP